MRSRIKFVANRVEHNLQESGTPVVLVWSEWPAGSVRDGVTNVMGGTPTEMRLETGAFLHFVNATSQVRQFNEVQVGDAIADISPKIELTGKDGLVFLLPTGPMSAGRPTLETWSNKPMSSQLATLWDTLQSGVRLYQTVLLRKAT